MNCKDFETNIYLYSELNPLEKNQLDEHLQSCTTCSALFEEVKQAQHFVREIAEDKILPANAARLTSNIMSNVLSNKQREVSLIDLFFSRARFVMTVLSIGLLIGFAVEFLDVSPPVENKSMAGASIILVGKEFRANFWSGKVKSPLFAACQSPFRSGQYYWDCVKSKMK